MVFERFLLIGINLIPSDQKVNNHDEKISNKFLDNFNLYSYSRVQVPTFLDFF